MAEQKMMLASSGSPLALITRLEFDGARANVTVTVWDNRDFPGNVTVTLYYNITASEVVGTQNTTLLAGKNDTLLFVWNTKGVAPSYTNYTFTAVATIPVDYTPADNTLTGARALNRLKRTNPATTLQLLGGRRELK